MLNCLAILFVFSIGVQANDGSGESSDTPTSIVTGSVHTSYLPILSGQPLALALQGRTNYVATQQVFHINTYRQEDQQMIERGKVPADYQVTLGMGAHKLHTEKLPWNEARKVCISEGAHLAIVNSDMEEKIFMQMMKDEPAVEVQSWLGFHDLYKEGEFVTIFDQPLSKTGFMRWTTAYPNEPDNLGGNQNCGSLFKTGGLDDAWCGERFTFICEISFEYMGF